MCQNELTFLRHHLYLLYVSLISSRETHLSRDNHMIYLPFQIQVGEGRKQHLHRGDNTHLY